jgi:acylglycerol lipase
MGGAEVLCWTRDGPGDLRRHIRGYLFEAPFIAFHAATKPSQFTVLMGRFIGKFLPRRQMIFKLDEKLLSRDVVTQKVFVEDNLCHDTGTLEGLAGNLDRAIGLDTGKILVPKDAGEGGKTRIWLSHGTEDGVCDYHGTERVYSRLDEADDKELKLYDGWFHKRMYMRFSLLGITNHLFKVHAEPSPDRETYANDVANWIFERCGSLGSQPVRSKL